MADLTDIKGIGGATASTIEEAGVSSVDELAEAEPSDIEGLSDTKASKLIRRASQKVISSKTATDLLEEFEDQTYGDTGIPQLNDALGGGWESETVGLLYGKSDTGKTQVLFSTMGAVAAEGTVVYLMTEMQSKSIADRLRRLSSETDHLDNIHIYEAYDVEEQYDAYEAIREDFDNIDLLAIDSFTAQFRMEPEFEGRENLGDRSAEMGRHLRLLGEMSRVYQMPVILVGQVYEKPDAYSHGSTPWGGMKMYHYVSYFLNLSDGEGVLKKATVENHPGTEGETVTLRIGDEAIEGVDE